MWKKLGNPELSKPWKLKKEKTQMKKFTGRPKPGLAKNSDIHREM